MMAEFLAAEQATSTTVGTLNVNSPSETNSMLESAPIEGKAAEDRDDFFVSSALSIGTSLPKIVARKQINESLSVSIEDKSPHEYAQMTQNGAEMPPASNEHDASKLNPSHIPTSYSSDGQTLLPSDTVRGVVLPLLLQNANLRKGNEKSHSSETVQDAAQNVLTNEVCQTIAMHMAEVQKQLHASNIPNGHVRNVSDGNVARLDTDVSQLNRTQKSSNQRVMGNGYSRDFRGSPSKRRRIDTGDAYSSQRPASTQGSPHNKASTISRAQTGQPAFVDNDGSASPPAYSNDTWQPKHIPSPKNGSYAGSDLAISPSLPPRRGKDGLRSRSRSPSSLQSNRIHRTDYHSRSRSPSHVRSSNTPTPSFTTEALSGHRFFSHDSSPPSLRQPNGKEQPTTDYAPDLSFSPMNMSLSPTPQAAANESMLLSSDIEMKPFRHDKPAKEMALAEGAASTFSFSSPPACHKVPGIWGAKQGLQNPGILEFSFYVDVETAHKWSLKSKMENTDNSSEDARLVVHLLCLPIELVASALYSLHSGDMTKWMSHHTWPAQGSLIVEMNCGKLPGKTWLPHFLGPENAPLNITEAIHIGENKIRCIQLSSLQHLFAIHASVTLEPEAVQEHEASADVEPDALNSQELEMDITVDFG